MNVHDTTTGGGAVVRQVSPTKWESGIAESGQAAGFFYNPITQILLGLSLIMLIGSFGLLAYFIRPTETLLVLHYNVYFGVDVLGAWWQLYILPVLGSVFLLGHLFLAQYFYVHTERIAAYLLLLTAGLLNFCILIACVGITFINY